MPITLTFIFVRISNNLDQMFAILCALFSPGEIKGNTTAQTDIKAVKMTLMMTKRAERIMPSSLILFSFLIFLLKFLLDKLFEVNNEC
jgi:hypothetical protein